MPEIERGICPHSVRQARSLLGLNRMKTIEISFANRRKEKIAAETISLTDAPGWVVLRTAGNIVEMISAGVIKREIARIK